MTLAIPFAWKVTNQTHLVKLVEVGFLAEYVNKTFNQSLMLWHPRQIPHRQSTGEIHELCGIVQP
ncbi:hypothetical protein LINPERHAP2_LOCUS32547 [Linum perenne]